jgi:mannosyl-glycoprotein endo-beta-N-acetylglucosaminidase
MSFPRNLLFFIAVASPLIAAKAQTSLVPTSPQWHPNEILNWNPATDPSAPYARSTVPLATRISVPTEAQNAGLNSLWNVNTHARPNEGRIQTVISFNSIPAGGAQGWRTTKLYAPTFWQYNENMVFWGSSDRDTRVILAPTAHVIDAAHRNGVPVYGKIFFGWNGSPDNASLQRIRDLLQKSGSTFPVADKLVDVAKYYGFDGWFVNQENYQTNSTDAQNMRDFIVYFRQRAAAQGVPNLRICWYDAMAENGSRSFQNAFTTSNDAYMKLPNGTLVAHEMFLNFWWWGDNTKLADSRTLALSLGLNPYDIYAGIWTENYRKLGVTPDANGNNEINIAWDNLFPEGQPHNLSVALYGGETPYVKGNSSTANVIAQEQIYYTGQNSDPSNTSIPSGSTITNWRGLAHYIPAKSSVQALPFSTNFNVGQGTTYRINGTQLMTGAWTNLSLQDVLPTWRWIVTSQGAKTITPSIDFSDSYYGPSSLLVSGGLTANIAQDLKLYQTNLPVSANAANPTYLRLVFRPNTTGPARMRVALAFENNPSVFEYVDVDNGTNFTSAGWNTRSINLTSLHSGKQIVAIGIRFLSTTTVPSYSARIGRLQLYNTTNGDGSPLLPSAPSNVVVDATAQDPDNANSTQLRVRWTASPSPVYYYNVYSSSPTGTLKWLGATPNTYFFAPEAIRVGAENNATLLVEAVGSDFGVSTRASSSFNYAALPVLTNKLSGTIIGTAGSWNNGGDTKEKAMDNNTSTAFDAQEENGVWVGLDLGSPKSLSAIRYFPRSGFTGRIVGGVFQGANQADFSDAVTLATVGVDPGAAYRTIAVYNTTAFRYVRYLGPNGSHGNIAELAFYGTVPTFQAFLNQYYTTQQQADPAISGPEADPAKTGAKNLLAYASGVSPANPDRTALPAITTSGSNLTLTYVKLKYAADVTYTVEVSSDMVTWQSGASFTTQVSAVDLDENRQRITVRDNTAISAANARYIRLKIAQN